MRTTIIVRVIVSHCLVLVTRWWGSIDGTNNPTEGVIGVLPDKPRGVVLNEPFRRGMIMRRYPIRRCCSIRSPVGPHQTTEFVELLVDTLLIDSTLLLASIVHSVGEGGAKQDRSI